MGIGRTIHGCKSKDLALVQLYSLAGGQIIRRNNTRLIRLSHTFSHTAEDVQYTLGYILYVRRTPLHICIIHRSKHLRKVVRRCCYGKFCIYFLGTYNIFD